MNWTSSHFLNERLLFGALGGVIPIAIHLLNRARYDVRGWGAMMFLQASIDAKAHSIRMQQLILLILRCLFFAVLAIALSNPITAITAVDDESNLQATSTVLIVDTSGSTRNGNADARAFDEIRKTALSIVNVMGSDDDMLVIKAGVKTVSLYPNALSGKEFVSRKIKSIEPGFGKARMSEALSEALHLLEGSINPRRQIIILTDGQKISWPSIKSPKWEEYLRVRDLSKIKPTVYVLAHATADTTPNVQIVRIQQDFPIVDVYRNNRFTVDVRNGGGRRKIRIDFFAGGRLEGEREMDLQPGLNTVTFDISFREPGPSYLQAVIPGDGLAADNRCVMAIHVVRRIPVLLMEGHASAHVLSSDGGCLKMALSSTEAEGSDSLFDVTLRNQTTMDEMDSAYLNQFKSIVLANVTSLSTQFRLRVERYVRQGGGLFIILGPDVDSDNYNVLYRDEGGLLPSLLKGSTPRQQPSAIPVLQLSGSPIFANIGSGSDTMLKEVKVHRLHLTTPSGDSQILASCNEFPLLLKKSYGKGQVVMWTSTTTPDWTNFPLTEDFLPLMQNVVVTLSSTISPPINLRLGETLLYGVTPESRRNVAHSRTAILEMPNHEKTALPIHFDDGQWVGSFEGTSIPGLHSVKLPDGNPSYYAIQLDPEEGDLTTLSDDDQDALNARLGTHFLTSMNELNTLISRERAPTELWLVFLVIALGALTLELFLGYRFS